MSRPDNKQLVAQFWEAFSAADLDAAAAMLADDFTWWIGGRPEQFPLAGSRSKAAFLELFKSVAAKAENGLTVTPRGWTVDDERIAMEAESYGVFGGRVYNNLYHFLLIIRDGKIQLVKEYLDTMHANDILCGGAA